MASASEAAAVRHQSDLYTRPGWVDAAVALGQLDKGKASGDRGVLWVRGLVQRQLRALGRIQDKQAGIFLFVSVLVIGCFTVGLKSLAFHSDAEVLWAEPAAGEAAYSPETLSTHQMIIQTGGEEEDADLLHPHGLLDHLAMLQKATQVTINMFDITWRFKDFCQKPSIPTFDQHLIEQIFEHMMPCSIVTALDCFWEGSKLLGPNYPVQIPYGKGEQMNWTKLNPIQLLDKMKNSMKQKESTFDFHFLEDYLKRSGITTGYQEKPCLNPRDPECPETAPNYNSTQNLDIGAEMTSGCYGFAAKYMHWPEDLIVGGVLKNKSGHIKQAKALQSVVQLMGEHELYEFLSGDYKVHQIGWNQEKATMLLNAWQKKFAQEVERLTRIKRPSAYNFVTFSTSNMNKMLKEASKTDIVKLGVMLGVVVLYGWVVHSRLAALGVLLLSTTAAAALGVCSVLGLPINLLSTHVIPFVSVGLAMRDMFLILSTHTQELSPPDVLQRTGPSIISAAVVNSAAFLAAAILPVPALRVFCLQCAVLVVFHCAALLIAIPALLQFCKRNLPCLRPDTNVKASNTTNNNNNDPEHGENLLTTEVICQQKKSLLTWLVNRYFAAVIFKPFVKVIVCMTYAVLIIFCVYNGLKLEFDVRISTFLPKNTQEYKYLEAQNKFFGFYNFYLVTTEMEYPLNQPQLYEYHNSLTNVPHVLKDSNGGLNLNDFWLANFRDFLIDLQEEFNENRFRNNLNSEKWFTNASEKAVLAFKLLAQTGFVESPVDKSQVLKKTLVSDGIIDPNAFYNYLSVWNSNDHMSYSSSQANLTPKPFEYYSSKAEYELKIPKSKPLVYTQMPFYLKNLRSTGKIIETLKQIKEISGEFNSRGTKNYPIGLIFAYYNQFLLLDRFLAVQFLLTLLAGALVACILVNWTKLWCPLFSIVISMLLMSLSNINALSGTIGALHFIIVSRNVVLILTGFVSALGSGERRLKMSLELYAESIIKGDFGLFVCVSVLITSQFEFIQDHFFVGLLIAVGTSTLNSLIFFPILLSLAGPRAELYQMEHSDRIATPTPPPTPPPPLRNSTYAKPSRRNTSAKATREPSLTTITEESCNQSQSVVVEPHVTVEYSSPESSSSGPYTTKVTATANIKVELVAPVYRSKCSKCRSKCKRRCCKQDSDSSDSSVEAEPGPSS